MTHSISASRTAANSNVRIGRRGRSLERDCHTLRLFRSAPARQRTTRLFTALTCLTLGLLASLPASSDPPMLAHYQISIREGGKLNTIQTASNVTFGVPIEYKVKKYELLLVFDAKDANAYVLTISLASLASPEQVIVKGSFKGRLSDPNVGPLDFNMEQNGVKVSGAVALSTLK